MILSDRRLFFFALGLAMMAGFVDALGFISLHGVFLSFMSGNSTRFAVALTGAGDDTLWLSGAVIALFVLGVMLGTVIGWRGARATRVMALVSALLIGAGVLNAANFFPAAIVCMTLAMGAVNTAFGRGGEINTGLTYMTGTLVRIGQKLAAQIMGEKTPGLGHYGLLWSSLILGAVLGTLSHGAIGMDSLWLAAAFAASMTSAAWQLRYAFQPLKS